MEIRMAESTDVPAMSALLERLVEAGKRTARADMAFVQENYVSNPVGVRCSLALNDEGKLLGFQSLIHAVAGNRYGTPPGWGIVGTHVALDAARSGVGRRLFDVTRQAAIEAGLSDIEAFIGHANIAAQAYYESIGFRTYRTTAEAVCKRWSVRDL